MITINLDKAKAISHDIRRSVREEEFKPLDSLLAKQIPNTDTSAIEAERQAIRDKYSAVQEAINSSSHIEELLNIIQQLKG